jgi:hypothetical protein
MAYEDPIERTDEYHIGEDKSLIFTIYQSNGTTAQDITGWSLEWVLKADYDTSTALLTKTTGGSGIALTTPVSGICTVTVDDTDTDSILPGRSYVHVLKRTDSGNESILTYGTVAFKKSR